MAKRGLPKQPPEKKAAYDMPEPNDDIGGTGFELRYLRHPSRDADGTVWPGRPVFDIKQDTESIDSYGPDVHFLDPRYVQLMLDASPDVRKAVEKVKAAGYTPEALKKLTAAVVRVFEETVLVDIVQKFFEIAPLVAQCYAAKRAAVDEMTARLASKKQAQTTAAENSSRTTSSEE